jgi:hypothetical protein
MTNYPYILFNKAPLQLRLIGARGGRTFGRNQRIRRARLALIPTPPQTAPLCAAPQPMPSRCWTHSSPGCDAQRSASPQSAKITGGRKR